MEVLIWLEQTGLGTIVRSTPYLYPVLTSLHLVGLALLVGPAAAFDLRLLGLGGRTIPVSTAAGYLLPMARLAALATVATGLVLFIASAASVGTSTAALAKLLLLIIAAANVVVFHLGVYRSVAAWDATARTPTRARLAAGISLLAWTGVIICGRFIAYL